MRMSTAVASIVHIAVIGCGGDSVTRPSQGQFPVSKSGCGPYYIQGLAGTVVDPTASSLEARLVVGQRAKIGVAFCGSWTAPFVFTFTNDGVLGFRQDGFFGSGDLQANRPGQTRITVEFEADDGKRYRTSLGYCPGDNYCTSPREIDVVTVVAP